MSAGEMTLTATIDRPRTARRNARRLRLALVGFVLPVGLGALWELAVHAGLSNGRLVPPPSVIFTTLWELARTGELWVHTKATVARVAAGFVLGVAAIWRIVNSPYGMILRSIRENENRAISLGYSVQNYKLGAFVMSAALAGLAGGLRHPFGHAQ